jgi:hypothetical protein
MGFKFSMLRSWDWGGTSTDVPSVLKWLENHWRFKTWELEIDPDSLVHDGLTYQRLIGSIVELYGREVGKPTAEIWIDHTPTNIQYAWTLFRLFPEAKMIHIVRDGRAVAASIMPLDWGPNEIHRAAQYWVESVAYGLAAESWGGRRVIRVKYEDLVMNPKDSLGTLCSELGIGYEDEMSNATGFEVPKYTVRQHSLIGSRLDPTRVDAWKDQLTPRQIEIFESITADLLCYLGYTPQYGLQAKPMSLMEIIALGIGEIYKRELINRLRIRWRRKLIK